MPTKIGIAQKLWMAPEQLSGDLAGAVVPVPSLSDEGGGKPPMGSVTITPEPTWPAPVAPTSTGTRREPTVRRGHLARPDAATRSSEPVSTKFERWSHPRCPAPSESHRMTPPVVSCSPRHDRGEGTYAQRSGHRAENDANRNRGRPQLTDGHGPDDPSPPRACRDGGCEARCPCHGLPRLSGCTTSPGGSEGGRRQRTRAFRSSSAARSATPKLLTMSQSVRVKPVVPKTCWRMGT